MLIRSGDDKVKLEESYDRQKKLNERQLSQYRIIIHYTVIVARMITILI